MTFFKKSNQISILDISCLFTSHYYYIYSSTDTGSLYEILSLHCSLLNLQRSLEALKPYTTTESYLLCVSGVSCHGEKIPFEVWPPSFTLTIMLLALSCPLCKAHVFSFVQLPLPHSCTPPGFSLLCRSLSHCYPFSVRRSGPKWIPPQPPPPGMLGSVVQVLLVPFVLTLNWSVM